MWEKMYLAAITGLASRGTLPEEYIAAHAIKIANESFVELRKHEWVLHHKSGRHSPGSEPNCQLCKQADPHKCPEELRRLFYELWTKSISSFNYDEAQWKALEQLISKWCKSNDVD